MLNLPKGLFPVFPSLQSFISIRYILSLNYWGAKPQKAMKPDIILFEDLHIKALIPLEKC